MSIDRWKTMHLIGLGHRYEEMHWNVAGIKWDRLPNPTTEERVTGRIPVVAEVFTANNRVAWLLLRLLRWRFLKRPGMAAQWMTGERKLVYMPRPRMEDMQ